MSACTLPAPSMGADWRDLVFAAAVAAALFLTVVLLWNHPYVTFALLALVLAAQGIYRPRPGDGITMLFAAVLGTAGELVEVSLGEWTYHAPDMVYGLPVWIPLIWANLFGLFRRLNRATVFLMEHFHMPFDSPGRDRLYWFMRKIFLVYGLFALVAMNKMVAVVAFYALIMAVVGVFWKQERDFLILYWGALLGAFGEFVCIQLGYWEYYDPFFTTWGVDVTLPLDWGLSAVILDRIGRLREQWLQRRPMAVQNEGATP